MMVHPDQAKQKFKHNYMTCSTCVQLPLDVDGIYARIDNQMLKPSNNMLVQLAALYYGRNPDIGTLKK